MYVHYLAKHANTVQNIQLGELLCESLVNADDASALQFNVGPNEVSRRAA